MQSSLLKAKAVLLVTIEDEEGAEDDA